jgi:hypothetical protein
MWIWAEIEGPSFGHLDRGIAMLAASYWFGLFIARMKYVPSAVVPRDKG